MIRIMISSFYNLINFMKFHKTKIFYIKIIFKIIIKLNFKNKIKNTCYIIKLVFYYLYRSQFIY